MDQGARAAHHAGSKMEKPKATIGPFRATKLWNTIVSDFRSGIPLKRHRWRVRYYDNCFTSTEAADWLLDYLCNSENFGPWVTRSQVVLLLDKFVQSKIIEEVKASKAPSTEKAAFEDNGHLYKFLPVSPMKKLRSALASRSSIQSLSPSPKSHKTTTSHRRQGASLPAPRTLSMRDPHPSSDPDPHPSTKGDGFTMEGCSSGAGTGGGTHVARPLAMRDSNIDARPRPTGTVGGHVTKELPRCTLISRPLTVAQIEEVWKSATLVRLQRLLWLSTLDGLLDDSIIVPSDIIHNCTHLNKNGVVQLLNKEDDLPHWVISAMRCLANWPNKIDSELPSYLGFERDVFKTISNYFQNLPEPLITYSRYDLVVEAFGLYLNEDKSYCQEALRLCLLLLPSTQRRALHLLLRLMSKMEANHQLVLSSSVPTRQLLLRTFSRCILRCEAEVDLDESLALRIVGYLLDNHATLFAVPQELREDIKERLTYLKRSQIKYEVDTENVQPAGFCAQVSMEEYEQNKAVSSQRAIEDLLDSIIADRAMPHKDKRKKLKLFQKAYPEIYHRRLPTSASEAELFPAKPKIKQPMLNVKRSLSKLKPIR